VKRLTLLLNIFLFVFLNSSGQAEALRFIDQKDLRAYMNFLAADELQGRETGTHTNNIASLYLESNLRKMGLKPPFENGRFLQQFDLKSKRVLKTSLHASSDNGSNFLSTDSVITIMSGPDVPEVSGEIVFAGYGYEDSKTGYSDLRDVDMKNKIVLIMTRNPVLVDTSGSESRYVFDEMVEAMKLMSVFMRGPKAVLMIYDPKNSFSDPWESGLARYFGETEQVSLKDEQVQEAPAGIYFISEKTADILLSSTGSSLQQLQEKIDVEKTPRSSVISGIKVTIDILSEKCEYTASNVVGIIEGSDPVLKNECVIYTAHFDHSGITPEGEILNGADDNASGTAGLLEIAEAFQNLKKKPLRSVVFAWVNAEEKGLLGSGYYSDHPVIPMKKTILNINLDMIGRSITPADTGEFFGTRHNVTRTGEILLYSDNLNEEFRKMVLRSAGETGMSVLDLGRNLEFGSSDHASLSAKGVPWMFFHSGIHTDLHAPGDDIEKIDFGKMEKVSRLAFMTGYRIADSRGK
jgi:hypothetical protein